MRVAKGKGVANAMPRLKVMTVVGTRPELIKLSRVIPELDKHVDHVLVHTGQNYAYVLNEIFFDQLGIRRPDRYLDAAGKTAAETIANVISNVDAVLEEELPDALLVLGDTNSCLSTVAAKRRKVPIFHMEAGNRAFDERIPEEINRRIVDHISDINLVYTEHARRHLLSEGLAPDRIIKTGSPMAEVLDSYMGGVHASRIVDGLGLVPREYLVVSAHREENVDDRGRLEELLRTLETLVAKFRMTIVFSTHPRTRRQLEDCGLLAVVGERIELIEPLGLQDYVRLQMDSFCVLSDSGSLTEEASILNFPAVALRESHERPEGMDEATVVMAGLSAARVVPAVELVTSQHDREARVFELVTDYESRSVSRKVVRIVLSYIDYVNDRVWRR